MIINITKVMVPRTLVFGMEEAKASPWNVACFRSAQKIYLHIAVELAFRIPAVVQTDSGIILAFAEVIGKLYPSICRH